MSALSALTSKHAELLAGIANAYGASPAVSAKTSSVPEIYGAWYAAVLGGPSPHLRLSVPAMLAAIRNQIVGGTANSHLRTRIAQLLADIASYIAGTTISPATTSVVGMLAVISGGGAVRPPFLRGLNYSGQESGGSSFAFPFAHALQYFIDKGADVIRLTFSMERLCPTPGGALASTYAGYLKTAVDYLTSRGCRVILDPHNGMHFKVGATIDDNSVSGGTEVIIGATGSYTQTHLMDFFARAYAYFNHPLVIWSFQNEPDPAMSTSIYYTMAQAWITQMRGAGYNGLLLLNGIGAGTWYWQVSDANGNRANFPLLVDALNNLAVDIHHYPDDHAQGTSTTVVPEFMDKLTDFTTFCRGVGLKAFGGEIGAGRDATNLAALATMLAHIESNSDVYVGHAEWTAVQYQDSTFLNFLPTELTSSDVAGPYTDRPQMGVMAPYFAAVTAAPSFVADPVISGSATVGAILTATNGGFTGFPAPTVALQWYRDGVAISGATGASYTLVSADVGHSITVKVTATNASGSTTSNASNAIGPVISVTTLDASHMSTGVTSLTGGNLIAGSNGSGQFPTIRSTNGASSGKKYYETKISSGSNGSQGAGICDSAFPFDGTQAGNAHAISVAGDGNIYGNNANPGGGLGALAANDVVCIAVDIDNQKIWARKNGGNWNNSGTANPATNTGGISISFLSGTLYPVLSPYFTTLTANFGATAYAQTAPSGFGNW